MGEGRSHIRVMSRRIGKLLYNAVADFGAHSWLILAIKRSSRQSRTRLSCAQPCGAGLNGVMVEWTGNAGHGIAPWQRFILGAKRVGTPRTLREGWDEVMGVIWPSSLWDGVWGCRGHGHWMSSTTYPSSRSPSPFPNQQWKPVNESALKNWNVITH